ncbi:MAG: hypothetical protein PVG63_09270, partial [Anaerolineales bacterium]
ATFALTSKTERRELGNILKKTLAMLSDAAHQPDYNFMLNSAGSHQGESAFLHWSLQIRPRTVTRAGFEIGSGMRINPHLPIDDARQLRGKS